MAAILRMMIPFQINDSTLTSSTVAEADYPVWDSVTIYDIGDRVIKGHRIYEGQVDAAATKKNQNKDPEDPINQFGPIIYWVNIGPTNKWAMFDGYKNTQTIDTTSITVVLKAGAFNMIYLDGLDAKEYDVVVKDAPGGNVIYTSSGNLRGNRPDSYWEYWFNPFANVKSKILTGIPPYTNMELTLTLESGVGAQVKCGVLAIGMVKALGRTQQGAEAKSKDYGYVKTDQYGMTQFKPGKKALDITGGAIIDRDEARQVQAILEEARGVPSVISCSDKDTYSGLNNFGFTIGKVVYKTPDTSEITFTQEGII